MLGMWALMLGLLAHGLAAFYVPNLWLLPDFACIALVWAIGRKPQAWASYALVLGLLRAFWAIRDPWRVLIAYGFSGWLIVSVQKSWLRDDPRLWALLSCVVVLLNAMLLLWWEGLAIRLFSWAFLQALLTGCTVLMLQYLFSRFSRPVRHESY